MNIPDEVVAQAHKVATAERRRAYQSMTYGRAEAYGELAGAQVIAEWARKEALREAAQQVRDYWDACGELIDSNNGARLAFDAVAAQIAEASS